jgi:hypothetical protein
VVIDRAAVVVVTWIEGELVEATGGWLTSVDGARVAIIAGTRGGTNAKPLLAQVSHGACIEIIAWTPVFPHDLDAGTGLRLAQRLDARIPSGIGTDFH